MTRLTTILLPALLLAVACGGARTSVETGADEHGADEHGADEQGAEQQERAPHEASAPAAPACANAVPVPSCESMDVETMSADELVNQWDSFEGQTVHVLGGLRIDPGMCTLMECGPENPCCNSCGGALSFARDVVLDESEGRFGCEGNSCGLCCGYAVPSQNVRTSGRPGVDAHGYRHLYDAVVCVPSSEGGS
ncbi:MAG: hypothetical protein AB8H86_24180 [Polyangiales bacterium]